MIEKQSPLPPRLAPSYGAYRLAGVAAVLLAAVLVSIGVTYLFIPPGMKVVGTGDPAAYYRAMIEHPGPIFTLEWETVPLGLLGVVVVLGVTRYVRTDRTEGWLACTAVFAAFGFLLKTLDSLRGGALHQLRAAAWLAGDDSTRSAIGATRLTLDYLGWFAFGAVGLWVLAVNVSAVRQRLWDRWTGFAGAAFGVGFLLLMFGECLTVEPLLDVCIAVTAPAALLWFPRIGLLLLRRSALLRGANGPTPAPDVALRSPVEDER